MADKIAKQLYNEKGESWIMKTNDFSYYISLKKKGIPTEFTGKSADLEQLLDDLTEYLTTKHKKQNYETLLCK